MADQNINNMSVTWASGGTTFAAIKMNVTDTASAAASKLIQLQVAGADKFTVDKSGNVVAAGSITFGTGGAVGLVVHFGFNIEVVANKTHIVVLKCPFGCTVNEVVSISASGTCTATWNIDGVNLGGSANSVSSVEQTQAHGSANTIAAGQDLKVVITANAACLDAAFTVKATRTS